MIPPNARRAGNDGFASWLLAYDAALAAGRDTAPAAPEVPGLAEEVREAQDCLDLLEKVWPRAAGTLLPPTTAETPPFDLCLPSAADKPGRLGRFQLLHELGRGGCGVVFLAEDPMLGRRVALKVPHPQALISTDLRERFLREARAAAGLDHPNIVPVYEAGEVGPICYLASAYCPGPTLGAWLKSRREPVPVRTAARLVAVLADAVHYTHRRGILHRDLTPSNIILMPPGGSVADPAGELGFVPRITDFGLAKLLDAEAGPCPTRTGAVLGTPQYMAPEQAEGRLGDIGPATDVYALGILLYQTLLGQTPFPGGTDLSVLQRVLTAEPPRPSALRPQVHRDLEVICLKCLEKEPRKRYASAGELADDLRHFLDGEPIKARPPGRLERLGRWCRRRPTTAVLMALAVVAAVVLLPLGLWYRATLAEARQNEQTAQTLAFAAREAEEQAHKAKDEARKAEAAARQAAITQEYYALLNRVRERSASPRLGWTWEGLNDLTRAAQLPAATRNPVELRTEAAACLAGVDLKQNAVLTTGFTASVLAFSPDGKTLAVGQFKAPLFFAPCPVLFVDLESGKPTQAVTFPPVQVWERGSLVQDGLRVCAFSPDGKQLAIGTRGGWVHRWDLTQQPPLRESWAAHKKEVLSLAFARSSAVLFTGSRDGTVKRWDAATGQELARHEFRRSRGGLSLSPAGDLLACGGDDRIDLLDPDTLQPRKPPLNHWADVVCFSPDGRTLAAQADVNLFLLDPATGEVIRTFRDPELDVAHPGEVDSMAFHPDGSVLVSGCSLDRGRRLKLWETATGRLLTSLFLGGTNVIDHAFSPDGRSLAALGDRQTVLYDLGGLREQTLVAPHSQPLRAVAFSPDGRRLACAPERVAQPDGTWRREVSLWEIASGREVDRRSYPLTAVTKAPPLLAFHPKGNLVASAGWGSPVEFWAPDGGPEPKPLAAPELVSLGVAADGETLWAAADGIAVRSWALPSGAARPPWSNRSSERVTGLGTIHCVAAGRAWVLAGGRDGIARLLRGDDGQPERNFTGPGGPVICVALAPDESVAALGTQKGVVRLVRVPDGETVADLEAHTDEVTAVAFSGDGGLLVTGSRDRTVRLWLRDGGTYRPYLTLRCPTGGVKALALTPDGRHLAVLVTNEAAVRLWHLDRLHERLAQLGLDEAH